MASCTELVCVVTRHILLWVERTSYCSSITFADATKLHFEEKQSSQRFILVESTSARSRVLHNSY